MDAGQWFLDRLALVEGAQSQRGLVICFKGLSDALLHLLALVDKRLKVHSVCLHTYVVMVVCAVQLHGTQGVFVTVGCVRY